MKRNVFLMVVIMVVMMLSGCSGTSEEVTETTEETETIDVIPNPEDIFSEGNVSIIMSDPTAYYQIKNYKDGEYETYLDACKEAGFTDVKHKSENDGNKIFMAYDENNEYYLELSLNGQNQLIDVVCTKVEEP